MALMDARFIHSFFLVLCECVCVNKYSFKITIVPWFMATITNIVHKQSERTRASATAYISLNISDDNLKISIFQSNLRRSCKLSIYHNFFFYIDPTGLILYLISAGFVTVKSKHYYNCWNRIHLSSAQKN